MVKDRRALGGRCCAFQGGMTRVRVEKEDRRKRRAKRSGGWWNRKQWKRRGGEGGRREDDGGGSKDAWSGQDRRTNGGHRTEMASGSAFQYSTLATLGHPLLLLSL